MHTTLYYRDERSDKVYRTSIEDRPGGHVVTFAYGRRGSTLATGTKTNEPVGFETAQKIYDKLIREKLAKGYSLGADSVAYTLGSRKVTSLRPQLLNPTEDPESLLADDRFYLQPKHDGKRLLLQKQGLQITGINRRGIECGIPESIRSAGASLPGNYVMDGEAVGDTFHVFDLLEADFRDWKREPYEKRLARLLTLLAQSPQSAIQWVATIRGAESKQKVFNQLREDHAEGIVFKRISAPYSPGRPASGGDQLKYKFVSTASVIVNGVNTKRSVAIAVWENDKLVPCGNVTIPADQPIPEPGAVVEVRYLYAIRLSCSLFQPVYLGVRDDIASAECTRDQLKFRKEEP